MSKKGMSRAEMATRIKARQQDYIRRSAVELKRAGKKK